MNAFLEHGAATGRERRPAKPSKKPEPLELSPLEKKMRERQRLSHAFRAWRRAEVKAVLASEPRLVGFLKYLRTVDATKGPELLEAIDACSWLREATLDVRIFALRMISARCDKINQMLGNEAMDDPLPPDTSLYFLARDRLHFGGRA